LKAHSSCCAAALPRILDITRRALNNSFQDGQRTLCNFNQGQPNNGMHPTANSAAFIRKTML
jgi:hypothetical protein